MLPYWYDTIVPEIKVCSVCSCGSCRYSYSMIVWCCVFYFCLCVCNKHIHHLWLGKDVLAMCKDCIIKLFEIKCIVESKIINYHTVVISTLWCVWNTHYTSPIIGIGLLVDWLGWVSWKRLVHVIAVLQSLHVELVEGTACSDCCPWQQFTCSCQVFGQHDWCWHHGSQHTNRLHCIMIMNTC